MVLFTYAIIATDIQKQTSVPATAFFLGAPGGNLVSKRNGSLMGHFKISALRDLLEEPSQIRIGIEVQDVGEHHLEHIAQKVPYFSGKGCPSSAEVGLQLCDVPFKEDRQGCAPGLGGIQAKIQGIHFHCCHLRTNALGDAEKTLHPGGSEFLFTGQFLLYCIPESFGFI